MADISYIETLANAIRNSSAKSQFFCFTMTMWQLLVL